MAIRPTTSTDVPPVPRGCDPDTWAAHVRLERQAGENDLKQLAEIYDPLARSLARQLDRGREAIDDLEQIAREALIKALLRFEPARGVPFVAFARPTIIGTLRRHYRDRSWLIHLPRSLHDLTVSAHLTSERLTDDLGRHPTAVEVAEALGVTIEDLLASRGAVAARGVASLDVPVDVDGTPLAERVGGHDRDLSMVVDRAAVSDAMKEIPADDRLILRLYYFDELTQAQIGDRLGISQMQVSRRLAGILARLRRRAKASEGDDQL